MTDDSRHAFAEAARADRPDLALLCLLLAAEAGPQVYGQGVDRGVDEAQIELDELAGMLPYRPGGPQEWARATAELLGGRLGFHGSGEDYRRLESSLLPEVLRRRRGLPILLSVVWLEVARRAGAPVYGVALPGHFVIGFGDPQGPGTPVLADPFDGGRPLSAADAELLVVGATGQGLTPSMMRPADPLEIVLRILNNIRAWAASRPERSEVHLWAVELPLLLPAHPARLRLERAQLLVDRGDFAKGATEMDEYAAMLTNVDPAAAKIIQNQARTARARMN
ncbi:transglutaminase-like domain-containing protein [Streptomyces polyrhachis]|uniref:Transglutaminase-like domain-containing protein n=1 Tax=Streptomyces polyrhachis TaxID=1282885 RepID=A0ABW2GIR6_9ACTN